MAVASVGQLAVPRAHALAPPPAGAGAPIVRTSVDNGRSGRLGDAPQALPGKTAGGDRRPVLRPAVPQTGPTTPSATRTPAPALAPLAATPAPPPLQSFDGLTNSDDGNVLGSSPIPPDPTGEVGPNNYVQAVNDLIGVFSKTGVRAAGFPKAITAPWAGTGSVCEQQERGDPIMLYDQLADRWVVSFLAFALSFTGNPTGPFYECIAVSTSGDPTGAYNHYMFLFDNNVALDYPKLAVWPDGYYMTVQESSNPSSGVISGMGVVAFDRSKMLAGQAAGMVRFDFGNTCRLLPSDVDGTQLPPAGAPNYVVNACDQALNVYRFHVNFTTPSQSTLTGPASVAVSYDPNLCSGNSCVPQPNTTVKLDPLAFGVMNRAPYRNFGDHESILLDQPVDLDGTNHAGVAWYELRNPGGTPSLFQQGTLGPDGDHRWMSSIAMDRNGDVGLGYSVSSSTTFPSVRYAGRLSSDPLGALGAEASLVAGGGSETASSGRWGDYSHLSLDPTDECTFWFTAEYFSTTSSRGWRTRIGSFRFPQCGAPVNHAPPADFDGNGTTDISVFRPSTGQWLVQGQPTVSFGLSGDIPVPCDYNGDGTVDKAVFRPSTGGWYISGQSPVFFGLSGDIPVPGYYNGAATCDIAVFRPSSGGWYVQGQSPVFFGLNGDIPVPGDYDGNGTTDIAVFRPSVGGWYRNGAPTTFFGLSGDVPVPGDYDGSGTTEIAVFRPSGGQWFVSGQSPVVFGLSTDIPLPLPAAIRLAFFP